MSEPHERSKKLNLINPQTDEDFFKSKKATLYLLGHYWACQECVDFLKLVGITEIKFDDLFGGQPLKEYQTRDLTGKDSGVDVSGYIVSGIVTVKN